MSGDLPRIVLLPPDLCNQIAAGEVVERPASVVKELVENSLDALSTMVEVHLESGGQGLIRVQDNGMGMLREDLELALTRHATSKIRAVQDLDNIHSYGFRGEALPSVASVSRCTLTSAAAGAEEAWSLRVEFGKPGSVEPASLHKGTIVEIRDLFANVPARLKFLRGISTEIRHCQDWLSRLALARPDVSFRLVSDGRELVNFLPGQTVLERLEKIWPALITEALIPFDGVRHGMRVHGLAAQPRVSQPRGNRILLFVNGRSVSDKKLLAAIREAYKGRITSRDHPQVVLFLEIDPVEVDVNVHPAKSEVRFRDDKAVFSAVLFALRTALDRAGEGGVPVLDDGTGTVSGGSSAAGTPQPPEQPSLPASWRSSPTSLAADSRSDAAGTGSSAVSRPWGFWGRADEPLTPAMTFRRDDPQPTDGAQEEWIDVGDRAEGTEPPSRTNGQGGEGPAPQEPGLELGREPGPEPDGREVFSATGYTPPSVRAAGLQLPRTCDTAEERPVEAGPLARDTAEERPVEAGPLARDTAATGPAEGLPGTAGSREEAGGGLAGAGTGPAGDGLAGLAYLGQVAGTYLVLRDAAGALLLLDQHAAHERVLFARITANGYQGQRQCLAVPMELDLHPTERMRWQELGNILTGLGFTGSLQGGRLQLRTVPALLGRVEARNFLREALAGRRDDMNARFVSMACKAAIKAGQELARDEALTLIGQWLAVPDREYCPHGRPAVLRWDSVALERLFKRRQS